MKIIKRKKYLQYLRFGSFTLAVIPQLCAIDQGIVVKIRILTA